MTEETKVNEDVLSEEEAHFECCFEMDPYQFDSLDWYAEAVDAYLESNFEKAKVAAMLADFRLELEEEMEDEDEEDEEEEEEEEEEESEDEDEGEESEDEEEAAAEEDELEAEETIELQEIQVATGEELIKAILKDTDSSQAKLAEAIGVSRSTVCSNLNKGVNAIQLDDFAAYLDALGYELIVLPKDFEQTAAAYVLAPEVPVEE